MSSPGGEVPDPAELAAALEDAITIWALSAVIEDPRPGQPPLALLVMVPTVSVHTHDEHPGAEAVDLVASSLLRWGFGLVTGIEFTDLAGLPLLPHWQVRQSRSGRLLQIREPGGVFYDGDLHDAPEGWHIGLRQRGYVAMLVGSTIQLDSGNRAAQLHAASLRGDVVGARVPLSG
jgi:hypothetical protein